MQCITIMHCIGGRISQRVIASINGRFQELELPEALAVVWPGLSWGRFEEPLTPAFWVSNTRAACSLTFALKT